MGVRENRVEKYLDKQVKLLGGLTRKWVSPGQDGVPDRIVILDGVVIGVEVKCLDGRMSTAQHRERERLTSVGMTITTVYGSTGVDGFILDLERFTDELNTITGSKVTNIQSDYR